MSNISRRLIAKGVDVLLLIMNIFNMNMLIMSIPKRKTCLEFPLWLRWEELSKRGSGIGQNYPVKMLWKKVLYFETRVLYFETRNYCTLRQMVLYFETNRYCTLRQETIVL
jgi:hypothetical protein